MSDWTSGYVTDVGYIYSYHPELNPLRARWALLQAGFAFPDVGAACELGFGQGVSINVHAAASPIRWVGTDFNPSQAAHARQMAAASGSQVDLVDQSFEDFAARQDLPCFDYIGLHGVWSWVSDANRAVIVDFIRRKLNPGGVLYASYNTLPGWAGMVPLRDLLMTYGDVMGSPAQGRVARVDAGLSFASRLLETQPAYARDYPAMADTVRTVRGQDRQYVAHEFFNRDWQPMSFGTVCNMLEPAKLDFAASAHFLDYFDAVHLTPQQQALMQESADPRLRQSLRDFMVNQPFRRDYWVRGPRILSALERAALWRAQRVVLGTPKPALPLKVSGARGEVLLNGPAYGGVLDAIADHVPRSLGELERQLAGHGIALEQIVQVSLVLAGLGHVFAAQEAEVIDAAKGRTDALNAFILGRAHDRGNVRFMVSPVSGGGVAVDRVTQLFILALRQGLTSPQDLARAAWQTLAAQGEAIVKGGVTLPTPAENLGELVILAQWFVADELPALRGLQVT